MGETKRKHRICPWWMGYFLASPLRRLKQNPFVILRPFVKQGMNVADIGCAMGFFSLPMGKMVGEKGRVYCFDVQAKMLKVLNKRVIKSGMTDRFVLKLCENGSLSASDIRARISFALCYAVVHEVLDSLSFFKEIFEMFSGGGKLIFGEPKKRVSESEFKEELETAKKAGFKILEELNIFGSRSVLLGK